MRATMPSCTPRHGVQVNDNDAKGLVILALRAPPPLGAFVNPAPISKLPFTGQIGVSLRAHPPD